MPPDPAAPTPEDLALDLRAALDCLKRGAPGVIGAALRRALAAEGHGIHLMGVLNDIRRAIPREFTADGTLGTEGAVKQMAYEIQRLRADVSRMDRAEAGGQRRRTAIEPY